MSAPTAPVMCFFGKLYRNSATYATPTWVLVDNVGDVEVTDEMAEVVLKLRMGLGNNMFLPGERSQSLGFKMLYNPADTSQAALRTAYLGRSQVDAILLDQAVATVGSSGPRAVYSVFKAHRTEGPNGEAMMFDVAMKPGYSTNLPSEFTVSE